MLLAAPVGLKNVRNKTKKRGEKRAIIKAKPAQFTGETHWFGSGLVYLRTPGKSGKSVNKKYDPTKTDIIERKSDFAVVVVGTAVRFMTKLLFF